MDLRIDKVIEMMSRSLHRPLPVGDMAASVNLSYSRLEHLFKAETGMTLVNYRKRLRMEKARELLETTFLSNKQIILRVGMCDESHFVRDFKKTFGLRPGQYRRLHQAAAAPSLEGRAEQQNQPTDSRIS